MNISPELHQQTGYDFTAAVFEVHKEMGNGFPEEVYHECLVLKFIERNIPFKSKPALTLFSHGRPFQRQY